VKESRPALEIVWSHKARARLNDIRRDVAADKPAAAEKLALRIVSVVSLLRTHPHMGRAGARPGLRELVIGGAPYIVICKAGRKQVNILTIWHGAQESRSE